MFFCGEHWEVVQDRDVASMKDAKAVVAEEHGAVDRCRVNA